MASSTTKTVAAKEYDHDEALGDITPRKVEVSSEVNLEGRSSRGSTVGSPEEVIQLSDALVKDGKRTPKDAVTAWLDLRAAGTASTREMDLAISRVAESVGWEAERTPPLDHSDNIPEDVRAAQERADAAAAKK